MVALLSAAVLLSVGCGAPQPQPATRHQPQAKPEDPPAASSAKRALDSLRELTGRESFQLMWVSARSWAPDAQPFRLANLHLPDSRGMGGKSAAWTASFSSDRLRKWRYYTYSTVKTEHLRQGLFSAHDESFRTVSELTGQPFPVQALKTDSDEAFRVAEEKGGRVFRQKNPGEPVTLVAEFSRNHKTVLWSVYYGASPNDGRFTVRIDAVTGKSLQVEK